MCGNTERVVVAGISVDYISGLRVEGSHYRWFRLLPQLDMWVHTCGHNVLSINHKVLDLSR